MGKLDSERDVLKEIPSPSARLWLGLCVILSIFVVFAVYAFHKVRWLEDFQVNVVQQNRKASLQLLRLQNDAYLLAVSLRDMTETQSKYPIHDWRAEFSRLHNDIDDAVRLESGYAVRAPAADDKRAQLRAALNDFWRSTDKVFALAGRGREATARTLVETELERQRAVISEIVSRLLVFNDQAQTEAAEKINAVYGSVKQDILIVIAALFLLALGTGLYTFQANRKTFEKLRHLAEQLQTQSEQLRKLSWKLIDVQEETLRRVGRDLHDEFGQILTAIGVMLSRASRKALEKDPVLRQDLGELQTIVEQTLQKVRDQSQMFRPAILDDFGLAQTLQWFVQQFSRQAGIEVAFEGGVEASVIPSEDAIHLYRMVQEALSNVARHSKARNAWVSLRQQDGVLNLEIRDNGVGLQLNGEMKPAATEGTGLLGMQERAEHLNAKFALDSAPGKGTVVRVRVPLKRSAAGPASS